MFQATIVAPVVSCQALNVALSQVGWVERSETQQNLDTVLGFVAST